MWFQVAEWRNEVTENAGIFCVPFRSLQCGSVASCLGGKVDAAAWYSPSLYEKNQRQVGGKRAFSLVSLFVRKVLPKAISGLPVLSPC